MRINPNNFFKLLNDHNLKVKKKLVYPDHYKFSDKQIKNIIFEAEKGDYHIIMTEKDFSKFKYHKSNRLNFLKVSLELKKIEKFLNKIKEIYA